MRIVGAGFPACRSCFRKRPRIDPELLTQLRING